MGSGHEIDKEWTRLAFLDVLRPEPGWRVELAVIATYSADLVAVMACLLALAGADNHRGSGSKVDVANAIEAMRDRMRVLVQTGRMARGRVRSDVLVVLDQFIREVQADENHGSWHPKMACVRLKSDNPENPEISWRVWLGSKNLTRSMDYDAGMALVGSGNGGQPGAPPGLADSVVRLVERADLLHHSNELHKEIESLHWAAPEGVTIRSIRLEELGRTRSLPEPPEGLRRLLVVSPFLDGTCVHKLGTWGNLHTRRSLVSTISALGAIAHQVRHPLKGFELLALAAPVDEDTTVDKILSATSPSSAEGPGSDEDGEDTEEREIPTSGLHAKLILAEHAGGYRLWLGSANVTKRGWMGPNAEVIAELDIGKPLAEALWAWRDRARPLRMDELPDSADPDDDQEALEKARKALVANWTLTQRIHGERPVIEAEKPPEPAPAQITLEVGLVGAARVPWPRGQRMVTLPAIDPARATELLEVRLCLGDLECVWVQRAPLDPPPDQERDRRAIAAFLDARTFLMWIRALLDDGVLGDGGPDWDRDQRRQLAPRAQGTHGLTWWTPTLEELLQAWTRDPRCIKRIGDRVDAYFQYIRQGTEDASTDEHMTLLDEFYRYWKLVHAELGEGT